MTTMFSICPLRIAATARRSVWLLLALCAAGGPAWAINIYDVVQLSRAGYGNNEIIVIIDATESVFELTSEDIVGLENLGISPQVIDAMLARAAPPEQQDTAPTIDLYGSSPEPAGRGTTREPGSRPGTYPATRGAVPAPFSIDVLREEGAGGHHHFAVDLYGARLLVLRDEGRYRTAEDRAAAIAGRLDEARRLGTGEFRAMHINEEDVVVFRDASGTRDILIVAVSNSDAIAYDVRSERRVTADLLAMYWSALLNDYWTIAFERQPPEKLRRLHRGEALMLLYAMVRNIPEDDEFSLVRSTSRLPRSVQAHLENLALAVPEDFDEDHE